MKMPYYYTQERKVFSPKVSKRKNQADNDFSVTPTFKNNKRNALSNLNYNRANYNCNGPLASKIEWFKVNF